MIRKMLIVFLCIGVLVSCLCLPGCGEKKEIVVIYTSAESYRVEHMWQRLNEEFPQYEILLEYLPTGSHAARLLAEGLDTDCDITYDLEYTYLEKLETAGLLADLSGYDLSVFCPDVLNSNCYVPEYRNGGAVIVNPAVLKKYGLDVPSSYDDLLKAEYQGLISMPNPVSSGTGYMFLLAMANSWGEDAAFTYFDALAKNVLQFTSSGSGPVNALIQEEVAIGLGITGTAVNAINEGSPLEIMFFEEGSPYALYGQAMIRGKKDRAAVREVFDFLYGTYAYENCQMFYPERIFENRTFQLENYPADIAYCDMTNNTAQRKEALLSRWKY